MSNAKKPAKPSVKKKAPVGNTGGGGFSFENTVSARFMLDLIGQTNALGRKAFGQVVRLDWQARESGWLFDDLVVTFQNASSRRTAGISIKSGQKVTTQGFPPDFIATAWSQWFADSTNRTFAGTADVVVLVTGRGTQAAKAPWDRLLADTLETSSERIARRLTDDPDGGQQTSKQARSIFGSFSCPPEYLTRDAGNTQTVDLIRQVRWLDFDYDSPTSQDYARAIADCKAVLSEAEASRAADLWEALKGFADGKRKGGTLDLPGFLMQLRGQFSFRGNPDYAGDWAAIKMRSNAELAEIKTEVAGLPRLTREADLTTIAGAISARALCFLIGESGSGKSALAKEIATSRYNRVIWLSGDMLDHASLPDFEKSIGLSHGIAEVIDATMDSTIIVLDAVEGYTERARKVATQLVKAVRCTAAGMGTPVIVTAQAEFASDLAVDFHARGFPGGVLDMTTLERPSEPDVRTMVAGFPKVGWVALNPDVRSLLTNLKILDWFVQFSESGGTIDTANVGLTNLIDSLWGRWVESGVDKFAKSALLQQIATIEADTHIRAVPTSVLGHAEQMTLGKLSDGELLRVRDGRIQFSHDLLSDWSRLKVLVVQDWLTTPCMRERYTAPRWYRAIRLYGQRLLEQAVDNNESWRKALKTVDDGTPTGTLIRDLFLEALFLAPNAGAVMRQAWPVLTADNGKLLKVLLERFLYVATIPDPRLAQILGPDMDTVGYEHLMRIPHAPYWKPLISVLDERRNEVVNLAPGETAEVCAMWLRSMNFTPKPGYKIVGRQEAAELVYAIAREAQRHDALRELGLYSGSKAIYEALLLASTELPGEVGQLCLELANRRDLDSSVAAKVADERVKRIEARKTALATAPKRKTLPSPISIFGPLREPWPDGPRSRVGHPFVEACLDGHSYGVFAKANPEVALEVLLAVCIEEPQEKHVSPHSLPELSLNYWRNGEPAIWFRGPFYALMTCAPEHGLTFVIKLANFATERYCRHHGKTVLISGKKRYWYGDLNALAWHYDGYLSHGALLQCALMALEKWFYDRIDGGEDVTSAVDRIMHEGCSLALAGLLLTVAKKKPQLLIGPLTPLLESWELIEGDSHLVNQREHGLSPGFGYWGRESMQMVAMAQEWMTMPHRGTTVRDLLTKEFLPLEEYSAFFERLLATWENYLSRDQKPPELRKLIETLRRSNYTFDVIEGKVVPVAFKPLAGDDAVDSAAHQKIAWNIHLSTLPFQCRKALDAHTPIATEQVEWLVGCIRTLHEKSDEYDDAIHTSRDVVLSGVAVLICLHYNWLADRPAQLAWCRERLHEVVKTAGLPSSRYSDTNIGNDKADAFSAESGVSLLARDRSDPLARTLVAQGITGFLYSTTQLVVNRAIRNCPALGDDFKRIIVAVLEWSAMRPVIHASIPDLTVKIEECGQRKAALERQFVDGSLTPMLPDLKMLNARVRSELDEVHAQRYPEHAAFKRRARQAEALGPRISLYPDAPGFDVKLVSAALSWLRPDAVTSFSRADIVAVIRTLLDIVIESVPEVTDSRTQEIEGLPGEFDSWVFKLVASAIPLLSSAEEPEELWRPIVSLGAPAHQWVERFCWEWFTLGWEATPVDPAIFFREWSAMIEFVLADPRWDHEQNGHHEIGAAVHELLGFNPAWSNWIRAGGVAPYIDGMTELYERAAARWFSLPRVLSGFVRFVQRPAAFGLAIPAIPWVAASVRGYGEYDWRYGIEDRLIEFLGMCWQRAAKDITVASALRASFFEIVKLLAARGSHAALALQDRVSRGI